MIKIIQKIKKEFIEIMVELKRNGDIAQLVRANDC